jgi:hypothetical protein
MEIKIEAKVEWILNKLKKSRINPILSKKKLVFMSASKNCDNQL